MLPTHALDVVASTTVALKALTRRGHVLIVHVVCGIQRASVATHMPASRCKPQIDAYFADEVGLYYDQ
jgi:hypothetical protein